MNSKITSKIALSPAGLIWSGLLLSGLLLAVSAHAQSAPATHSKAKKSAAAQSPAQAGRPALKVRPSGDQAIERTVADAMGFIRGMGKFETNKTLNRVQWSGAGQMTEHGKMFPVTRYLYTVSFHLKGAREDITRTTSGKPERTVHVVLDNQAWDERLPGIDGKPASDTALNRRLQLARTPLGFTRAMLDADPSSIKVSDGGPNGKVTISFATDNTQVTAVLNSDYRPEVITMKVDGKEYVEHYADYKDLSEYGVMFATRWHETIDGHPHLDIKIDDGRVASYAVFPKPIAASDTPTT